MASVEKSIAARFGSSPISQYHHRQTRILGSSSNRPGLLITDIRKQPIQTYSHFGTQPRRSSGKCEVQVSTKKIPPPVPPRNRAYETLKSERSRCVGVTAPMLGLVGSPNFPRQIRPTDVCIALPARSDDQRVSDAIPNRSNGQIRLEPSKSSNPDESPKKKKIPPPVPKKPTHLRLLSPPIVSSPKSNDQNIQMRLFALLISPIDRTPISQVRTREADAFKNRRRPLIAYNSTPHLDRILNDRDTNRTDFDRMPNAEKVDDDGVRYSGKDQNRVSIDDDYQNQCSVDEARQQNRLTIGISDQSRISNSNDHRQKRIDNSDDVQCRYLPIDDRPNRSDAVLDFPDGPIKSPDQSKFLCNRRSAFKQARVARRKSLPLMAKNSSPVTPNSDRTLFDAATTSPTELGRSIDRSGATSRCESSSNFGAEHGSADDSDAPPPVPLKDYHPRESSGDSDRPPSAKGFDRLSTEDVDRRSMNHSNQPVSKSIVRADHQQLPSTFPRSIIEPHNENESVVFFSTISTISSFAASRHGDESIDRLNEIDSDRVEKHDRRNRPSKKVGGDDGKGRMESANAQLNVFASEQNRRSVSIIERNARIIKWLYGCSKCTSPRMGVSHSRSDEFNRSRHSTTNSITKSASMRAESINHQSSIQNNGNYLDVHRSYAEKPRSVSSNDVIAANPPPTNGINNTNNGAGIATSNSSTSLGSSFRSKISQLRKPMSRNNSSTKNLSSAKSTANVVESFMTNMNSRSRGPSREVIDSLQSYPCPKSTNLVLPLQKSDGLLESNRAAGSGSSNGSSIGALRRPMAAGQVGSGYPRQGRIVRGGLQIPSPVPSVSEPSPSDDNISMDTVSENDTATKATATTASSIRFVDSPSSNSRIIVSGYVTNSSTTIAPQGQQTFNRHYAAPSSSSKAFSSTGGGGSIVANNKLQAPRTGIVVEARCGESIAAVGTTGARHESINDNELLVLQQKHQEQEQKKQQPVWTDGTTRTVDEEGNVSSTIQGNNDDYNDDGEGETTKKLVVKRPDTLLAASASSSSTCTNVKLAYVDHKLIDKANGNGPTAPLAQSECFIVENSPAVDQLAFFNHYAQFDQAAKMENNSNRSLNNNNEETKNKPPSVNQAATGIPVLSGGGGGKSGIPSSASSRFQSRLKNPTAYEQRQRFIYGRYAPAPAPTGTVSSGQQQQQQSKTDDPSAGLLSKPPRAPPPTIPPTVSPAHSDKGKTTTTTSTGKATENNGSGSTGSSDTNGSKATSPEGSLHRGLIDDEIRDQPELTFGRSDPSLADQPSQITTIQEELPPMEPVGGGGGPVRLRDRVRKRSSIAGGVGGINRQMIESYDSTVSSLSIDSEDLMIDYESLDLAEEIDAIAQNAVFDNTSIHSSSLNRRSSRGSTSGGGGGGGAGAMGSWGRKKPAGLGSKRASLEAMVGELNSLKNEAERGSNQSQQQQQRQRALSDFPSPSSSLNGGIGQSQQPQSPSSHYNRILRPPLSLECAGLSSVNLDQQTYRHVVQDVTVMKTLLLRLKRALQETETTNPFESSLNLKNGLAKSTLLEVDSTKDEERLMNLTKDDLKEENGALRTQVAVMRQQLEEQSRMIQCLQHQLKLCRQRSFRKAESVQEQSSMAKDQS